ncbi:MAG TPA: FAD:protein FMN transferase [Anaerolineales bacterium]
MTQQLDFKAMGCRMRGVVDTDEATPLLQSMPARIEEWEQVLSRFRSDSELCELNQRAGIQVVVSQILWDVFEASRLSEAETRGLVNPLIMDALILAGYDRTFDELVSGDVHTEDGTTAIPVPALQDVLFDPEQQTLKLPLGARLDFGGVAKGWVAQRAMMMLREYGPALFSAGGDIAVSGPRGDGEPWEIGVEDPFHPGGYLRSLYLQSGAVATSGKDYRRWMHAGRLQHHIIDPRSGLPAETDIRTATVIAPDAILAEAFSKAILISGSEAGLVWLDHDERLAGLLVLENGMQVGSRSLIEYV